MSDSEQLGEVRHGGSSDANERRASSKGVARGRVLVVDDEELLRASLAPVLRGEGYEVSLAENGREALLRLQSESLPDVIVLDLRMPIMDGWEFRTIQEDDPKWRLIPVVAMSADGSPQATAVSAQAHLRKPFETETLLTTIERILSEKESQAAARATETERLASLDRLAANVGHEVNNPLAFMILNLSHSLATLRLASRSDEGLFVAPSPEAELKEIKARAADVAEMLQECQSGADRIRETVNNLQRLARRADMERAPFDVHRLIEESASMVSHQIQGRARLIKTFGSVPPVHGNVTALGQVFLNLFVNAVQAIPEGHEERNEIRVSTKVDASEKGTELVVEIRDSGVGIPPEILPHVFEPFFTTKPFREGTGLGLSISRQTVSNHGGRMTVKSKVGQGTAFCVFLPLGASKTPTRSA